MGHLLFGEKVGVPLAGKWLGLDIGVEIEAVR
jgi:hypothetical protein